MKEFKMWSTEIDELGIVDNSKRRAGCNRIIRISLITLLASILIGSIAILGIGIWTHEVEYGSRQLSGLVGVQMYQIDSLMMIAAGSAALVVTSVGLCGILIPQRCLLGLHISLLAFLALMLFAAGVLGYVFINELEDSVRDSLEDSIQNDYGLPGKESITKSWDSVQQNFKCCGVYGGINSTTSWALYKEKSFWYKEKEDMSNASRVPDSCCDKNRNLDQCTGCVDAGNDTIPRHGPPTPQAPTNYTLYTTGCLDKLQGYLEQNGILIGTAAIVVATFMIVEMVFAICVYRSLH